MNEWRESTKLQKTKRSSSAREIDLRWREYVSRKSEPISPSESHSCSIALCQQQHLPQREQRVPLQRRAVLGDGVLVVDELEQRRQPVLRDELLRELGRRQLLLQVEDELLLRVALHLGRAQLLELVAHLDRRRERELQLGARLDHRAPPASHVSAVRYAPRDGEISTYSPTGRTASPSSSSAWIAASVSARLPSLKSSVNSTCWPSSACVTTTGMPIVRICAAQKSPLQRREGL